MIELNFSNMIEEVIGVSGISEKTTKNLSSRIEDAHRRIKDRETDKENIGEFPSAGHRRVRTWSEGNTGVGEPFS